MTGPRSSGGRWRGPAAVLLLLANVGLLGANAVRQDIVSLSVGGDDTTVEGVAPTTTADVEATTADEAASPTTEPSDDAAAEETTSSSTPPSTDAVDDWPGGRGPVPAGPAEARLAVIDNDGLITLSGSAPDWATVTKIVQYADEKLPGGGEVVDNQLTWHPDANQSTTWGDVAMPFAATFPEGQSELDQEAVDGLDLAAGILTDHPTVFAIVIGHADSRGDAAINAELAASRAAAVVDYLISQGVVPGQIVVASAGEDNPLASNDTAEGRAVNRRAEIQFKNFLTPEVQR